MSIISDAIIQEVSSWTGVTVGSHDFADIGLWVNGREFGHLHGDRFADIPFTVRLRKELVAAGKASLHYLHPETGWVTFYIHSPDDVPQLIELLRMNYKRLVESI